MFRDVFSGGPGVGGGSLVFDADVPRLRAFHLQPSHQNISEDHSPLLSLLEV